MNSDENNKAVEVVNDDINNSDEQQHLVEPTTTVTKTDDEGAAPNAETEQAATDSAENKSEEIAQAKKNFMDRNKIYLFSDEQKLSQKIGFAINRVKAGEVITVEAFGNSISRGITLSSIVRDRLAQDDNDKKEVFLQTSFVSRTNDKTGKSYSGMQFKLSSDKEKLDQVCAGFQKPGEELKHLRASPRANSTRPRNRQRRPDANNASTRRRSASQNKKSSSKLEADSKRDKSASNRRSKSTQKNNNQQNQSQAKDSKSQQSKRRSNSKRKTDKDNNPAPPAAAEKNQLVEKRHQQRRQRRNNNKSQERDAATSNSQNKNQRNQQADKKADNNQRNQRRTSSRSQRKQNDQERPAQYQNNQRPRRQQNNYRPDYEAAPPSARSYRSNQRDELPPRQQNRRSARPENQRSDQQQRYPNNGRPYPNYGRRGGYGHLPEPPRFAQKQTMNQSIFSNGSYHPQQRQQGPRPGYFPAANKDSRPGYFPANKDPRMPLNAPISDYRQQSAQSQYPASGYGGRPMAHRYRDAEQRLPPQNVVHQ